MQLRRRAVRLAGEGNAWGADADQKSAATVSAVDAPLPVRAVVATWFSTRC